MRWKGRQQKTFLQELQQRLGAQGDFAMAYIISRRNKQISL